MQKTNIYQLYQIGRKLADAEDIEGLSSIQVYNLITNLIDLTESMNLKVTTNAISLLRLNSLRKKLNIKKNEELDEDLLLEIQEALDKAISTFESEIFGRDAYLTSLEKKIDPAKLIERPEHLFDNTSFMDELPPDIKYHIVEGTICLAFDRNTAAVFHFLLATEGYIRFVHSLLTKSENGMQTTFFETINKLGEIFLGRNIDNEVVSMMHVMRKYYRNESQHANRKFTDAEATEVLQLCVKILNELSRIMAVQED